MPSVCVYVCVCVCVCVCRGCGVSRKWPGGVHLPDPEVHLFPGLKAKQPTWVKNDRQTGVKTLPSRSFVYGL